MRVFTLEDYLRQNIPRLRDFREGLDRFEAEAVHPFLDEDILCAFCHGSFVRDEMNLASDIDYVIVINDETVRRVIEDIARRVYHDHKVPVNPLVVHIDEAKAGNHMIDAGFLEYLCSSAGRYGYRGTHPKELIRPSEEDYQRSLMTAMRVYLTTLDRRFAEPKSKDERMSFMANILQKPSHAVRVMVQHCNGHLPEDFYYSNSGIIQTYDGLDIDLSVKRTQLERLAMIKQTKDKYLALLEGRKQYGRHVPGNVVTRYRYVQDDIQALYPVARGFLKTNLELMSPGSDLH